MPDDSKTGSSGEFARRLIERALELREEGRTWSEAHGEAWLEERLRQWPDAWGEKMVALIYGWFKRPEKPIRFSSLGITIHPEKIDNPVAKGFCTLKAEVEIEGKSKKAIQDAARRLDNLLGAWTLLDWGSGSLKWWSWMFHDSGGGVLVDLAKNDPAPLVKALETFPHEIRRYMESALFWLREPGHGAGPLGRPSDAFVAYAGAWNALECLIEAVAKLRPPRRLTRSEKQEKISDLLGKFDGSVSPAFIDECYREVVSPGLKQKAAHVFGECFGPMASEFHEECFQSRPNRDSLYSTRNKINHGDVDTHDPLEVVRVEERHSRLLLIVLNLFGRLIRFPVPVPSRSEPG